MQLSRIRSILWLTTVLATGGAVAAIAVVLLWPIDSSNDAVNIVKRDPTTLPSTPPAAVPPLDSFEAAWHLQLRRSLVDAPASALTAAQTAIPPPGPTIRLIGTIVDGQHPRGVFMTGLTNVELKGVGEKTGGADILGIDENSATISCDGQTQVLHREKNPFDPTGESYKEAVGTNPPTGAAIPDHGAGS